MVDILAAFLVVVSLVTVGTAMGDYTNGFPVRSARLGGLVVSDRFGHA
jgi:hypothetical protein